tara:strand:- start:6346 stop:7488 length:1143 start_codon:yes stop_codon:yes gene_type:complete
MALNFPDSPSDGDTFNGYSYNSSKGAWVSSSLNNTGPIVSDTAPSNPINGDFWFDSSSAILYMRYDDGSSSQWLSLSSSGADGADGTATVYANTSVLPSSGNVVGSLAFATLTKSLHIWDGTEWDRVSTGNNETPRLTTIPSSTLALDGSTGANGTLVIAASDPEGFPITYSHDTNPASPNQVTSITNSGGTFTLVPSTNSAHAGNFTLRLKASDGVSTTSHAVAVTLAFIKSYRYIKVVINSVQGGGAQAQVTELSIADNSQTTSQVTAASFTSYGTSAPDPNTHLNTNSTGTSSSHTNLNFTGGTWTAEIDLGNTYDVGTGIKYLQVGTSDDANRFPNSVTVFGANQSDYSDQEAIVTNATVPAYNGVRQMRLVDLDA